jgi:hypothetical protein
MAKMSADWVFGLLAGTLLGFALAMIFVEPYWITPDSKARLYVAVGGILGAMGVMVVRNQVAKPEKVPPERTSGEPDVAPDRGGK